MLDDSLPGYAKTLGVDRDAREPVIKAAFRSLAPLYHPDPHPGENKEVLQKKEEQFKVLSNARDELESHLQAKEESEAPHHDPNITDCYKVLELNPDATDDVIDAIIDAVFEKLKQECPERDKEEVGGKLTHAYLVLKDQGKRAEYKNKRQQEVATTSEAPEQVLSPSSPPQTDDQWGDSQSQRTAGGFSAYSPFGPPYQQSTGPTYSAPAPPTPQPIRRKPRRRIAIGSVIGVVIIMVIPLLWIYIAGAVLSAHQVLPPSNQIPTGPTPTLYPCPSRPCVIYHETESDHWLDWTVSSDWKIELNDLTYDGSVTQSHQGPSAIPPIALLADVENFAIQAVITVPHIPSNAQFGISVCGSKTPTGWQGDEILLASGPNSKPDASVAEIWTYGSKLAQAAFTLETHPLVSYRVEVRGRVISLFVGSEFSKTALVVQGTDSSQLPCGRQVGLWSSGMQIQVRSFEIILL